MGYKNYSANPHGWLTADKRKIEDFPKPSPLCKLLEGKVGNEINLKRFHNESNRKGSEGWASHIRKTLYEMAPLD